MECTFQGDKVELRRLGLSDIFEVQRIANEVMVGAGVRGVFLGSDEGTLQDQVIAVLFAGAEFAEERITKWIKSLFVGGYDKEIFLPGVPELIGILQNHPDIEAFLESGGKLLKSYLAKKAAKLKEESLLNEKEDSNSQEQDT